MRIDSKRCHSAPFLVVLAAFVALVLASGASANGDDDDDDATIQRVAWLAGCWTRESSSRIVEEQWMAPRGRMILGMARTVSKEDGETVEFEAMRIEEREGRLVFTAKPSGQPEESFRSIEITDHRVVFENPEHDFPQRVGYQRNEDGSLDAWIEGRRDGAVAAVKRIDFPYVRMGCP